MTIDGTYYDEELYALAVQVIEEAKKAIKRNGGKDIVFTCAEYVRWEAKKD